MRSAIYWAAWNGAAYLLAWCVHVITHNLEWVADGPGRRHLCWHGGFDAWPVEPLPWVLLVLAAVNLLVFATVRPLGEDCAAKGKT